MKQLRLTAENVPTHDDRRNVFTTRSTASSGVPEIDYVDHDAYLLMPRKKVKIFASHICLLHTVWVVDLLK